VVGIRRRHLPTCIAGGDNLHDGGALTDHRVLEGKLDQLLGLSHRGSSVHAGAGGQADAIEQRQHVEYLERVAHSLHVTPLGTGRCLHVAQGGGCHLSTGHPIDAVVDEDDGNILTPVGSVYGLGCTDGGQVTIALVGEHHPVGQQSLGGGRKCGCTTVGRLLPVDVDIVVGKDGTPYRSDANGLLLQSQLGDHFGDHLVHHA